jgi:uncharacterized glyoxalase superfamily metalloenzyme YdcJ
VPASLATNGPAEHPFSVFSSLLCLEMMKSFRLHLVLIVLASFAVCTFAR